MNKLKIYWTQNYSGFKYAAWIEGYALDWRASNNSPAEAIGLAIKEVARMTDKVKVEEIFPAKQE
jgi:hypothetical protein